MPRSAALHSEPSETGRGGTAWAAAVAIVFAAIAIASLAVDLSLSLGAHGAKAPPASVRLR